MREIGGPGNVERNQGYGECPYRSGTPAQRPQLDRSRGLAAWRRNDSDTAELRNRFGSRQSRFWTAVDHLRSAATAEQLSFGWREPERLCEWGAGQRAGRKPRR